MADAPQRARARIKEWTVKEGHGSKKRMNDAVAAHHREQKGGKETKGQGWITGIIKGRQKLRLSDLDVVARVMGVSPGWIVREDGRNYQELTMSETKLVEYYRSAPEMVRHNWMSLLDYLWRSKQEPAPTTERKRPRGRGSKHPHSKVSGA